MPSESNLSKRCDLDNIYLLKILARSSEVSETKIAEVVPKVTTVSAMRTFEISSEDVGFAMKRIAAVRIDGARPLSHDEEMIWA